MTVLSHVTAEQIARAKEWDLLSYLQTYEPQELKRTGPHEFCTVTHDSLKISNGKWHWCSRGIGGKTALDYLIHVRGMDFVEAVQVLCGADSVPISIQQVNKPEKPRPFVLPEVCRCATHVVSYLQGRGIDPEIIGRCIQNGSLYENKKYHNCVFVGWDKKGTPRFACMRGTSGNFKQDVEGSDKRFSFVLPPSVPTGETIAVFESPIDALSLATINNQKTKDWDRIAYLSLGGTSPLALLQYLIDHSEISQVYLCLDNDIAGLEGMKNIRMALNQPDEFSRLTVTDRSPPKGFGKDYNDLLLKKLAVTRPNRERGFTR